jgi:hypothetical protein
MMWEVGCVPMMIYLMCLPCRHRHYLMNLYARCVRFTDGQAIRIMHVASRQWMN